MKEGRLKIYLEERKLLFNAKLEQSRLLDTRLLYFAGGALALSITFIRYIAPEPKAIVWLIAAWTAFIVSMLSTLISFLTSQAACERNIRKLDEMMCGRSCYENDENKFTIITYCLTIFSIGSFTGGTIFFVIFCVKNLLTGGS